jgi:two-component sensor histidine kinase
MKVLLLLLFVSISTGNRKDHPLKKIIDSITYYIPLDLGKADSLVSLAEQLLIEENYTAELKADFHLVQGAVSGRTGNSYKAIKELYRALSLYIKLQDTAKVIKTKFEICYNHHLLEEHHTALEIAQEALAQSKILQDNHLLYRSEYNLGRALGWSQDNNRFVNNEDTLQLALKHFKNAEYLISNWGDSSNYLPLLRGIGDAHYKLGNYSEATKYFQIIENDSNPKSQFISAIHLGMINRIQEEYPDAYLYYKEAERYALSMQNDFDLEWISREFSRLFEATGEFQKALEYLKKSEELYFKRIKSSKNGAVANLTLTYEKEQSEAQLAFQRQILEIQRSNLKYQQKIIFAIAAGLLLSFILMIFYYQAYQKNKKISAKNALLVKEQNHRVKNNLQMISALLNMQSKLLDDQKARDAFSESNLRIRSIGLIHQMLYGKNLEEIEVYSFVDALTINVVDTFSHSGYRPRVDFDLDDFSLPTNKMVPVGLILTELLTNSLKYAFADHGNPAIFISLKIQTDQKISFIYQDNGPGFKITDRNITDTFGLKLINLQAQQLNGKIKWNQENRMEFRMVFNL